MSDFIPEDFIQKVLEDSDIVSLVDSYVPLKRKGKDHWAQCPFCDDGSNPSFSVSDQKQFYYCFKCRASGNAIGFLMNYQSKDFVGAVEILAKNLGLEIPRTKSNYDREKFDELFRFNDEAKNFYKNNLLKPKEGEHIRSYLKERGISEEISKEFEFLETIKEYWLYCCKLVDFSVVIGFLNIFSAFFRAVFTEFSCS